MTEEEVWRLVTENLPLLRREVARRLPSDRRGELEELISDVVFARAHSIMATYDPTRGALPITHLCANVRWYAHKWVHDKRSLQWKGSLVDMSGHGRTIYASRTYDALASDPEQVRDGRLSAHGYDDHGSRIASVEVDSLLKRVPEHVAQLLRWSICDGYTTREIAEHLGVSLREVRRDLNDAMELAKDYAGVETDE